MSFNFNKNTITAKEVSQLDANSASLGIPNGYLMECAGLQATNKIYEEYNLNPESSVIILCGTGNNGGMDYVLQDIWPLEVFLLRCCS